MFFSIKGRTKKVQLRNSPEQQASNLKALKSVGVTYVSADEYYDNKDKYQNGIGLIPLKKSGIEG